MTATNESTTKTTVTEMEAFRSTSLSGSAVPDRVLIAPWGEVESTNGSFVVDSESARLVVDAFAKHGTDLPIDYEHQTLGGTYASPTGQAPAAGWMRRLMAEPGVGLLAQIEWTDQAKAVLSAKEYRYLSPVAIIRKTDRKLVALHSAALTNKPAIVGMQPIVHRADIEGDEKLVEPLAVLRTELQLSNDAGAHEVLLAASRKLEEVQQESRQQHINNRVAEAIRAGKLVEAQRTWAEALVAREERLFDQWFETAPIVVTQGVTRGPTCTATNSLRRGTGARAEFRANPFLARLTSEDAYASLAMMES